MTAGDTRIRAITFDFYNTLAFHRAGPGRGRMLMSWLADEQLDSGPWEHQVLYDVFERHGREYRPESTGVDRQRFLESFAITLFERLEVKAPAARARRHAAELWELLGPRCLALFPEVESVLGTLQSSGLKLAIVSNWQCGLANFTAELGLGRFVENVIVSAEVGSAKPDHGIFLEACRSLDVPPEHVLHVGDTVTDDVEGALGAGMHAALVRRDATGSGHDVPAGATVIPELGGVVPLIADDRRRGPATSSRSTDSMMTPKS